ncbi:hypothetical protein [Anthocerotibacter panamensis]|uniref:hypothetical protein n=1 Tax=Anthocerotibacter panamensis TaxID=2857077 RepID=UPI001C404880|nr:hypothetical protein [Anthocerotibacter panamensis]
MQEESEVSYPTAQRLLSGVGLGILWGGGVCGFLLALIPVGPTGFFLAIVVFLAALGVGVSLYWNAARAHCFECGTIVTATPSGSRCPNCGQRYRGVNRKLVKSS